jgi:nucleoside-diphosphate-sugar epimerase
MKILIIGKNSFIANSFGEEVTRIAISDIDNVNFNDYDTVINCSIHPNFREQKYDEKYDLDFLVAQKAHENKKHYIMISSRKVYGSFDQLKIFNEDSDTKPDTRYGENKLLAENKIKNLSDNHCILRCSNVYGLERNRKTFFGFCIDQLLNTNTIIFDINEETKRDFLPVEKLAEIIKKISAKKIKGLFNVGSSIGLEVGEVAINLIYGYEKGNFISMNTEKKDQFILNNSKLKNELQIEIEIDLKNHIKNIGKTLCRM